MKIPGKFHNPRITKVWLNNEKYHEWDYRVHIETQDGHNHTHHFTAEYEVHGQHGGHAKVLEVH